jgi:hypothetical protein
MTTPANEKCEHNVVAKYCFRCKRPDLAGSPKPTPANECEACKPLNEWKTTSEKHTCVTPANEWRSEFEKEFGGQKWVYANELTLEDFIQNLLENTAVIKGERRRIIEQIREEERAHLNQEIKSLEMSYMSIKDDYSELARAFGIEGDAWFGDPLMSHKEVLERVRSHSAHLVERIRPFVERVRLDVDVIKCDCGEPYKDSDLDLSVGELEQALDQVIDIVKTEK